MARRGSGNKASGDDPLPTLDNPAATKHQTMIEWAREGHTDSEIAAGVFNVDASTFCRWVSGAQATAPGFLDAYRKASTLRSGWFASVVRANLLDRHETVGREGKRHTTTRANTGMFGLYACNVIGWRVNGSRDDAGRAAPDQPAIVDGGMPNTG